MACLLIFSVQVISMIYCCQAELNTAAFQNQIKSLANDILGVSKFQRYIDENVVYAPATQIPSQFLEQLSDTLAGKISARMDAVTNLRNTIQADYDSYKSTTPFENCCDCCSVDDFFGRLKFHTQVNTATMCHTGRGVTSGNNQKYPNDGLLQTMTENFNTNPNLKWQYFGGEEGIMTIYPSNEDCNPKYDPRYRPWYGQTAFATPKDVVVVVDRSGSMGKYDRSGRTLMNLAKEAAVTVVNTLTPDDRVSVVFFNDGIDKYNSGCFSSKLAVTNPENKKLLRDNFINDITHTGGTDYTRAFNTAFDYFETPGLPENDSRDRFALKIILFLTDGKPLDDTFLSTIQQRNEQLNNSVVILTFGFGDGIKGNPTAKNNLENIARQRMTSEPAKPGVTPGRFILIADASNLRYSMARYYDFFIDENPSQEATVSFPYLDAFGLGLITSVCLPVHTGGTFRGVTCIDITLSDIFSDATYFSHDANNYAFIVDGQTRLLIHPLLPRPSDIFDDPTVLRVTDIEVAPEVTAIVDKIVKGEAGDSTFSSRRVLSRGDSVHEGVDSIYLESQYLWKPVGLAQLTLVVVMATKKLPSPEETMPAVTSFPYHRIDITTPAGLCRYLNRVGLTAASVIKFAPFAFTSPDYYLELEETQSVIDSYEQYFLGSSESEFRDGVKAAVGVSAKLDEVMNKQDSAWQEAVWRYLGTREGVMRVYPGIKFVKKYDPTIRTWYKRAIAQKDHLTLSKPYIDAFGAGIVVTLSKAIYEPATNLVHSKDDGAIGVMGIDFTLDLFNSFLTRHHDSCKNLQCFVIDIAGYIISHPDFVGVHENIFTEIENVHITDKEPAIASSLFESKILNKDRCINFEKHYVQTFWRIGGTSHVTNEYELHLVGGTNIYVIVKKQDFHKNTCSCPRGPGSDIPTCTNKACECPCYNRDDVRYDQCTTTFNFDTEVGALPPCTPDTPYLNLTSVAIEETDKVELLSFCYPVEQVCPQRKNDLNCSSTAGCQWCGYQCDPRGTNVCANDGGSSGLSLGVIVGIVVAVILILVIIVIVVNCVKKNSSANSNQASRPPQGRAQVYENRAMEMDDPGRVAPTAPHYGKAAPVPRQYEPPPKYIDVA